MRDLARTGPPIFWVISENARQVKQSVPPNLIVLEIYFHFQAIRSDMTYMAGYLTQILCLKSWLTSEKLSQESSSDLLALPISRKIRDSPSTKITEKD